MLKIFFELGVWWGLLVCVGLLLGGCFGYDLMGLVLEVKKSQMIFQWSDVDVDWVVFVSYESVVLIY